MGEWVNALNQSHGLREAKEFFGAGVGVGSPDVQETAAALEGVKALPNLLGQDFPFKRYCSARRNGLNHRPVQNVNASVDQAGGARLVFLRKTQHFSSPAYCYASITVCV